MKRALLIGTCLLLAAACGRSRESQPGAEPVAGPPGGVQAGGRSLRVNGTRQQAWNIRMETVSVADLHTAVELPGVVAVNQQRTAQISSPLEGRVVEVRADLGSRVGRQQVLLIVHAPALAQAKSAFLQAIARRNLARREAERAKTLLQEQVIQQKELLRREAEAEAAATEYAVLESNLHSFGLTQAEVDGLVARSGQLSGDGAHDDLTDPAMAVVTPVAGQVIFRDVIAGEFVKPDKMLFTVSDLSTLWAMLDAREHDLPALGAGSAVAIVSAVYPGRTFAGRVLHVGDVVDDKLRTLKVRVEVDNREGLLKPNMFVQGLVDTRGASHRAIAVPEEAIQTLEGDPVVFVAEAGDRFVARAVQLGEAVGRLRVIASGLTEGDRIVVAGAFTLKAELLKGTFAEEK